MSLTRRCVVCLQLSVGHPRELPREVVTHNGEEPLPIAGVGEVMLTQREAKQDAGVFDGGQVTDINGPGLMVSEAHCAELLARLERLVVRRRMRIL